MQIIVSGTGQLFGVDPQTGQLVPIPPQLQKQALQQLQFQQSQGSLQAQPESGLGGIGGSLSSGFTGALEKKAKQKALEEALGTPSEDPSGDVLTKLGEKLGLLDAPLQGGMTSQVPALSNAPSFALEAAPELNIGYTAAPEVASSVIPEAGASIIPDALPATLEAPGSFSLGAEGAAAPAAEGMFGGGFMGGGGGALGQATPYALAAAGLYGGYDLAKSQANAASGGGRNMKGALQGAASGAALGTAILPGVGTAIGAGIGGLSGLAGSYFGSSKGERQMSRDEWRKAMMGKGLFDDKYQGTLADNTAFDFGKDKFGFGTNEGDIDLSKPAVSRAAAWGNALAGLSGYGGGKGKEAISTQFTKASTANLKDPNNINTVKDNYKHFLSKMGINNLEQGQRTLDQQSAQGMSQQDWSMMHSALNEIYGGTPTGFDKDGNWVGINATPRPVGSNLPKNNGSPGRRPKK